jgi:hypothetical protein
MSEDLFSIFSSVQFAYAMFCLVSTHRECKETEPKSKLIF